MATCLNPVGIPNLVEMASCVFVQAFGGNIMLMAVVGVTLFAFIAWKFRIPFEFTLPLGLAFVAVLMLASGVKLDWLYYLGFVVVFVLLAIGIIRYLRRGVTG